MTLPSDLLALKNAWNGAVSASDRVRDLAATVHGLPADAAIPEADLESWHAAVLANSIAVMALRGLIEEMRRKSAAGG